MPVSIREIDGKYRIVEPGGAIATTPQGHARDGGGHKTRAQAAAQQRAINASLEKRKPPDVREDFYPPDTDKR